MTLENTTQKIDRLFSLFEKLKNKLLSEEGFDHSNDLIESFEVIISNYYKLKDNIDDSILEKYGEPVNALVDKLLNLLSSQIKEMEDIPLEIENRLNAIDKDLKEAELSDDMLDSLLDERSKLIKMYS